MIKCLVTGNAGFVGSHVADLLIDEDHEVIGIDNLSTGKKENINPRVKFIEGDICDRTKIASLDKVDYVFHLASLARIQPSIDDPITSNDTNVNGTLNILEYCRGTGAKIIFSSSSSIYEGDKLPTAEFDYIEPKNPYALQKYICEQYIELYGRLYDLDYTILRYFNVFGERQILEGAYAAVIGIFLDKRKRDENMPITNDGNQKRDFTYVKDVAKANLMAMNWNGIYNIGTGKSYSINQIANLVGGKKEYIGERKGEVRATLADNTKAKSEGWFPTMTIEDWINAY